MDPFRKSYAAEPRRPARTRTQITFTDGSRFDLDCEPHEVIAMLGRDSFSNATAHYIGRTLMVHMTMLPNHWINPASIVSICAVLEPRVD